MKVVALKNFGYRGVIYQDGDEFDVPEVEAQGLKAGEEAWPPDDTVDVRFLWDCKIYDQDISAGEVVTLLRPRAERVIKFGNGVRAVKPRATFKIPDEGMLLADAFREFVVEDPELVAWREKAELTGARVGIQAEIRPAGRTWEWLEKTYGKAPESRDAIGEAARYAWPVDTGKLLNDLQRCRKRRAHEERQKWIAEWFFERCWHGLAVEFFEQLRRLIWDARGLTPTDLDRELRSIKAGWWSDGEVICDVANSRLVSGLGDTASGVEFREIVIKPPSAGSSAEKPVTVAKVARQAGEKKRRPAHRPSMKDDIRAAARKVQEGDAWRECSTRPEARELIREAMGTPKDTQTWKPSPTDETIQKHARDFIECWRRGEKLLE